MNLFHSLVGSLALSLTFSAALVGCQSASKGGSASPGEGRVSGRLTEDGPISTPMVLDASYAIETAYESDVRVNGVAAGDLDPALPGEEVVAVDRVGRVHVLSRRGGGFEHEMIAATGGELVQVAVGDLLPGSPGAEIVAVGAQSGSEDDLGPGIVRVFFRDGAGGWNETSYTTPSLVHAIAVDGLEEGGSGTFVCAGFFDQVLIGAFQRSAPEEPALVINALDLPPVGNAKGVALTGEGFTLACDDGQVVVFRRSGDGYAYQPPQGLGGALARIDHHPEMGHLICDNDGLLQLVRFEGQGRAVTNTLESSKQRLRGAQFVDIDPTNPGPEACSAGYDGRIRVVRLERVEQKMLEQPGTPVRQSWASSKRYVARDTGKLHHLASGEIDGFGTCLISCGYSGDVLLIYRQDR